MRTKKKLAAVFICLTALCTAMLPILVVADSETPSQFDDWEYFYTINKSVIQHHAHPEKLLNLPLCRQAVSYTGGVACVMSVMRYASYDFDIRESDLADALDANEDEGVLSSNMVDYLNDARNDNGEACFSAEFKTEMTISGLKDEIDRGHPVICAIQTWNWDEDGNYSMELDYTNEWECGNWVVAIGYNKDNIFFMDSGTSANYTYIPNDKMMERWHDYEGIDRESGTDIIRAGIVVEILGDEKPDGERYKDVFYGLKRNAHPRKIMKLPVFTQATSYTSGPACMLSVMRYAKYDYDIREGNMALALGIDRENIAEPEKKMVDFLNAVTYNEKEDPCFAAEFCQDMTVDVLKAELDSGHPVICAVQAKGHSGEWGYGYWSVAIGYDADNIFFMDPSTSFGYTYIPNDELADRWHAYMSANNDPGDEYRQAGIVVEICGDEEPDCERYNDAFYGLM